MEQDKSISIPLKRKLGYKGGSLSTTLPLEHLEWLGAKDKDTVCILPKVGKKGKYLALWIEKKDGLKEDVIDEQTTGIYKED